MAKTSKTVPQKEKASSSRPSGDKAPAEPLPHEYVPGPYILKTYFKVENPSSVSGRSVPWMPQAVPDLEDWIRKLASTSSYTERAWHDLAKGTKSPVQKSGKDKKQKTVSQSEDPKPKTRRVRKKDLSKFRANLSQCEVELQKVSGERDALKLLCGQKNGVIKDLQADLAKAREEEAELDKHVEKIGLLRGEVDQIKAKCDRWKETIDHLAAEKETILAKLLSNDVQLRGIKQKSLAQTRRIEELETGLAEVKAEVQSSKVMADKSIAVYRADAEAAQMQLREASDREQRVTDLAKCQSRRETFEEIHTRGFEIFEEISRAKALEVEARQLVSFDEDDDEEGSRGGSDEEPQGEAAPEGDIDTGRS
uniref:Golgin subfamily A member 8H-like n=1 Tax=Nicotiana tabacum TaxID=4097 RepID=A0A1S4ALA4_TOBAC|nr:PREDICTED: golgin subfamily A member 8H-like [Nicotiana tabacum]